MPPVEQAMYAQDDWKTKPSDRFILKWIKLNLSARITPRLTSLKWLRPWMITVCSTATGVLAGFVFAAGWGFFAGCLAAFAQVMDGVDGQFARITGMQSKGGAFLDSVLDRYFDAALVLGMIVYLLALPVGLPQWLLLLLGFFALTGSGLVSYTTARAESLGIPMGPPTLASKGTRISIIVLSALSSLLWPQAPLIAVVYLAMHPNFTVVIRLLRAHQYRSPE